MKRTRPTLSEETIKGLLAPTELRWIDRYCPKCFDRISTIMEEHHKYVDSKDVHAQDYFLKWFGVTEFLKSFGKENSYEHWMDRDFQNAFLEIEESLKPKRFNRTK